MIPTRLITALMCLISTTASFASCNPDIIRTYATVTPQTISNNAGISYQCIQSSTNSSLLYWEQLPGISLAAPPSGYQYIGYTTTSRHFTETNGVYDGTAPSTKPCDSSTLIYGSSSSIGNNTKNEHAATYTATVNKSYCTPDGVTKAMYNVVFSDPICRQRISACTVSYIMTIYLSSNKMTTQSGKVPITNVVCSNDNNCTGEACSTDNYCANISVTQNT